MPEKLGRDSKEYRRFTAHKRRTEPPICAGPGGCNQEIDLTLHYLDGMSWTWDHMVPLSLGGDLLGPGWPKHRSCNARRQTGARDQTSALAW